MFLDLGHIEKCGFLHAVQHVSNITFKVFVGVVKFWPYLLYFMGNFAVKIFQVFKNGSKLVLPDRTGIWHVKNQTFIYHLCMLFEYNVLAQLSLFFTDPLCLLFLLMQLANINLPIIPCVLILFISFSLKANLVMPNWWMSEWRVTIWSTLLLQHAEMIIRSTNL